MYFCRKRPNETSIPLEMITRILNKSTIQFTLSFLLVLGALFFIFTPNQLYFKWISNFAVQAMLAYLVFGLLCFAKDQTQLMFVNFACCAALCVFLNKTVENAFTQIAPKVGSNALSIAHFNASRSNLYQGETIKLIKNCKADLISVQELSGSYAEELTDCMQDDYPYLVAVPDTSFHGLAFFSKYPITSIDTFHFNGKPNMIGKVKTPDGNLSFLSCHTFPAKDDESFEKLVSHLDLISSKIQKIKTPLVTFGEYNAVSWSPEIREFKITAGLNDSRKGASPTSTGQMNLFEIPVDHIFFSDHLDCLEFKTLDHEAIPHFGIIGTYQFKPTEKVFDASEKT